MSEEKHTKKNDLELAKAVIADIHNQQKSRKAILDKIPEGDEKDLILNMEASMQEDETKGIIAMEKMIEMFEPKEEKEK